MKEILRIGDEVIITEKTYLGEIYQWKGVVTLIDPAFIETRHKRDYMEFPQWHNYMRAYADTWTKHYSFENISKP